MRPNRPLQNVKYGLHITSGQKEENYSLAIGAISLFPGGNKMSGK